MSLRGALAARALAARRKGKEVQELDLAAFLPLRGKRLGKALRRKRDRGAFRPLG
ncbi:MAG: hypothetical protein P3W93_003695 [Thermus sp.]|nr:hypothetical protein [Thermus sp.]